MRSSKHVQNTLITVKVMDGSVTNNKRKGVRFTVQSEPKDFRIEDICEKMENLHLIVTKQSRSASQSEPACYNCNKKGHYSSKCSYRQESTCYRCNKEGQYPRECPIKPDPLASCIFCHRKGHSAQDCSAGKSNEALDKQDVRIFEQTPRMTALLTT